MLSYWQKNLERFIIMSHEQYKPEFVIAWTEPKSPANTDYQPVYPYNNMMNPTALNAKP